jgi:hypothetical protein
MPQAPQDLMGGRTIGYEGLKCNDCQKILPDFFASDNQTIILPRAAEAREHLEKLLAAPTPKSWGIKFRLEKTQSGPHKLEENCYSSSDNSHYIIVSFQDFET